MCRLTSILAHYCRKITKYFDASFRQFGDDDKRGSVVMLMSAPCHPHVNYIKSQSTPDSTLFHHILLDSAGFYEIYHILVDCFCEDSSCSLQVLSWRARQIN